MCITSQVFSSNIIIVTIRISQHYKAQTTKTSLLSLFAMLIYLSILYSTAMSLTRCIIGCIQYLGSLERLVSNPKVIKPYRKTYNLGGRRSIRSKALIIRDYTKLILVIVNNVLLDFLSRTKVRESRKTSKALATTIY